MDNLHIIILLYLTIINLIGFTMMGIDKHKAKKHRYRIPEISFFIISLIAGSLGCIIGMLTFRHKIRHWYFMLGLPLILILQLLIFFALKFHFLF